MNLSPSHHREPRTLLFMALGALAWLALSLWKLTSVPELDMDEAWFVSWARGEVEPADPLSGMTRYTGMLPYLLLQITGTEHGLLWLRGTAVVCNAVALFVLLDILRRLYPQPGFLRWFAPMLASLPAWLIFARSGIETCMFGPFLTVLGLRLLMHGGPYASFAGGLCWGIMSYNHVLGAFVPFSFAAAWFVVYRSLPRLPWASVIAGMFVGFLPRLIALVLYRNVAIEGSAATYQLPKALLDLLFVPWALWNTVTGRFPVLRFVGEEAWPLATYWLLALLLLVLLRKHWARIPREALFVFWAAMILALTRALAAPSIQSHYMFEPAIMCQVFLVQLGASVVRDSVEWAPKVRALAGMLALCNILYFTFNYHLPWRHPNRLPVNTFAIGIRNKHASNRDVVPKQKLLRALRKLKARQVIAGASIERPLRIAAAESGLTIAPLEEFDASESASVLVSFYSEKRQAKRCVGSKAKLCFTRPIPINKQFLVYRNPVRSTQ